MATGVQISPHLIDPVGDAVGVKVHRVEPIVLPLVVPSHHRGVIPCGIVELVPPPIMVIEQGRVGKGDKHWILVIVLPAVDLLCRHRRLQSDPRPAKVGEGRATQVLRIVGVQIKARIQDRDRAQIKLGKVARRAGSHVDRVCPRVAGCVAPVVTPVARVVQIGNHAVGAVGYIGAKVHHLQCLRDSLRPAAKDAGIVAVPHPQELVPLAVRLVKKGRIGKGLEHRVLVLVLPQVDRRLDVGDSHGERHPGYLGVGIGREQVGLRRRYLGHREGVAAAQGGAILRADSHVRRRLADRHGSSPHAVHEGARGRRRNRARRIGQRRRAVVGGHWQVPCVERGDRHGKGNTDELIAHRVKGETIDRHLGDSNRRRSGDALVAGDHCVHKSARRGTGSEESIFIDRAATVDHIPGIFGANHRHLLDVVPLGLKLLLIAKAQRDQRRADLDAVQFTGKLGDDLGRA